MTRPVIAAALPGIGLSLFAQHGHAFGHRARVVFAPDADPTPEQQIGILAVDLKKATDEVKRFAEGANTEIKNLGKVTEETKANADKALAEMNGISTRLTDLEQKMQRRGEHQPVEHKSIGRMVVDTEEVKAFSASGGRAGSRVTVEVKNITSASVAGTSSTTALVAATRVPEIIMLPNRPMTVRQLLMPGTTNSASIDYVKETVFTNNAAMVPEGTLKPQSDMSFGIQNVPVRTIAHWVLASRQILADAPMLQSYIDGRLRYGLSYAEDLALLLGDGTGANLLGLMPQATAYAPPAGVTVQNATYIDKLRLAMLQTTLALYPATGIVLNPVDWTNIVLTKDTQNRYIFTDPQNAGSARLWGLPVAESMAMPQNNFLTGAMLLAAQIFDREDATVMISTEDRDNFVKNMVTILAEERLGLAVYRPQALVKGTFATAP